MDHTRCYQCYERLVVTDTEDWIITRFDKEAPRPFDADWVIQHHIKHYCPNTPKKEKSGSNR